MQTWNAREAREPSWKAQVNMVLELVQALARLGDAEHNKQLVSKCSTKSQSEVM